MGYLSGEAIVGFFVAIGGIAIVLQRFGIIKLPTKRNSPGNPGNDKITSLKEVQVLQAQILEQYEKRFEKGDERFEKLETTIDKINVNVGILLDRTK